MVLQNVLFYLSLWQLVGVFGDLGEISVTEGDSVTLNSGLTELMEDDVIQWRFGEKNTLFAEIDVLASSVTVYKNVLDGRFRNRLKLNKHTGSLTITNTTTEDTGRYKLQINRVNKSFTLTVYARLPVPVIIRNFSQCSSSCSVVCSVENVHHVTLSWLKGNSVLSSISVSDLSISLSLPLEVEDQEKNTYSCEINNPITHQNTLLNTSEICQRCEESNSRMVWISAVSGFLLIAGVFGMILIYRKCRKTDQQAQSPLEITYADPTFYKRKPQKSKVKEEADVVYASVISTR